jgi:hypothetical protein
MNISQGGRSTQRNGAWTPLVGAPARYSRVVSAAAADEFAGYALVGLSADAGIVGPVSRVSPFARDYCRR